MNKIIETEKWQDPRYQETIEYLVKQLKDNGFYVDSVGQSYGISIFLPEPLNNVSALISTDDITNYMEK